MDGLIATFKSPLRRRVRLRQVKTLQCFFVTGALTYCLLMRDVRLLGEVGGGGGGRVSFSGGSTKFIN